MPEVSERLAEYLENPLVQADERLRLRCLIIKGETDEDLDPVLSEKSWREAVTIADRVVVIAGPPGRIAAGMRIDLARPRLRRDAGLQAIARQLRAELSRGSAGL